MLLLHDTCMKLQLEKYSAPCTSETTHIYFNCTVDLSKHQRASPEERSNEGWARCRGEDFQNDDAIITWKILCGRRKYSCSSIFPIMLGELLSCMDCFVKLIVYVLPYFMVSCTPPQYTSPIRLTFK